MNRHQRRAHAARTPAVPRQRRATQEELQTAYTALLSQEPLSTNILQAYQLLIKDGKDPHLHLLRIVPEEGKVKMEWIDRVPLLASARAAHPTCNEKCARGGCSVAGLERISGRLQEGEFAAVLTVGGKDHFLALAYQPATLS